MNSSTDNLHSESGSFSISFLSQDIPFSAQEGVTYSKLFHIVDCDGDGQIRGKEGAAFLRRANLANDVNREIWRLASGGKSQNQLNKDSWFIAMKLVALAQHSGVCKMQPLIEGQVELPIADFRLEGPPDNELMPIANDSNEFQVSVSTPVVVGSGYSKYTQYSLSYTTQSKQFPIPTSTVKRRFSDFEWLYQRLKRRYRGTIVPPIPEKRWTGNLNSTFIEERRQSLEHFMNEVCRHKKLAATLELQVMLTSNNEGLAAARDLLPSHSSSFMPSASSVASLWGTMKEGLGLTSSVQKVDITTDDDYNEIGKYVETYEERMEKVVQASEEVYQAQRSLGYEMSRFGNYLADVAVLEREDEEANEFFHTVGKKFEKVSFSYQDHLDNLLAQYMTPLRYQAGKIGSVKAVMHNRELAIDEVQQANGSLQRNKERLAAARASGGSAASASIAEEKMQKAQERMETAREQVDFIAKSLTIEAKRFRQDKAVEFRHALLALAEIQNDFLRQSREEWIDLSEKVSADPFTIEASKHRISRAIEFPKPPYHSTKSQTAEAFAFAST